MTSTYPHAKHLSAFVLLLAATAGHAATIAIPCTSAGLVGALHTVNDNSQANTLELAPGCTYTLIGVDNSDANSGDNGLPQILTTHALTVNGHGAIIERAPGAPPFRLLQIGAGDGSTPLAAVALNDLTLRYGQALGTAANPLAGAGIEFLSQNSGQLSLDNATLSGNAAGAGGAIAASGVLHVANSTISANTAVVDGAGIYASGTLTVDASLIAGNHQDAANMDAGLISGGGGIACLFCADVEIRDSIVADNSAAGLGGGGVALLASVGSIQRTRISGNSVTVPVVTQSGVEYGSGGGVAIGTYLGYTMSVRIADSAIYANSAATSGGGIAIADAIVLAIDNTMVSTNHAGVRGGGIGDAGTTANLANTTVAGNQAPRGAGIDIGKYTDSNNTTTVGSARFTNSIVGANSGSSDCYSDGGSIVANASSLLQTDAPTSNACDGLSGQHFMLRADPHLSPLGAHGGPDWSQIPLAGSPVIDAGDNTLIPAGTPYDQRGTGYARIANGHVDLGAIETGSNDVIFRNGFDLR